MAKREPRNPEERIRATEDSVRELAAAYAPVLRYADTERFFPVLAESWLTHTTSAPWEPAQVEADDLPVDLGRHGTALLAGTGALTTLTHRGGPPNPHDRPLQLATTPGDDDAIGNYSSVDGTTFLNFGGWRPGTQQREGDDGYLFAAFSELSAAMSPQQPWEQIEGLPHLPHMWVPQPPTPTVYAEVDWAGVHARASLRHRNSQFQAPGSGAPNTALDGFLTISYHYLYPMKQPPDDGSSRRLEGQWEAVTLFFPAVASRELDEHGRPRELTFSEPPAVVVASQGFERSLDRHVTSLRPWNETERDGTQVVLYVASGTHRHFFSPVSGQPWNPGGATPSPGNPYGSDDEGEFPGIEMLLVYAAILALAAVLLALGGLFVLAVIAAVLAIVLLILWLISLIMDAVNSASGDPLPEWQDNDEAAGDGAQAGSAEPAAGSSSEPAPAGGSAPAPGTPNAGSPTGRNTVSFDVRIVDLLHLSGQRTPFPSDRPVEHPHWWDYTGSWGINVASPNTGGTWESGSVRVDAEGRGWAYWSALKVAEVGNGGNREG